LPEPPSSFSSGERAAAYRRGNGDHYISLSMLYESCIHPLTILSALPSAGVGAVLALMLFQTLYTTPVVYLYLDASGAGGKGENRLHTPSIR
jgi:hypothetical protein